MAATKYQDWGSATSGESIGPYRLAEVLGEGGMGVVRRGTDPMGRSVAVKLLRGGTGDAIALRRLAREVDTMRRVRSPFVAQIVDADVTADPPYIVTQYVPGPTLEKQVTEQGPLGGDALKRLAEGLAEALAAIHAAGIVHRDLKPGNVMFAENGDPVLIDFGIAQSVDATRLTSAGMVIGTPGYLSPEILSGEDFRAPADVHAWAGTIIYAATGRPPFGGGTFEQIFSKILQGQPDLTGVPAPLLPVLRAAMAQHPAERPTARDLAHLCGRLDLEMTMIDHGTIADDPPTRAFPPVSPPQDVREMRGVPGTSGRSPLPQPSDFMGMLPPVAPPPDPYQDLYQPGRGSGAQPHATVNDPPRRPPYGPSGGALYAGAPSDVPTVNDGRRPSGPLPWSQPHQPQPRHPQPHHPQPHHPRPQDAQGDGRENERSTRADDRPKPYGLYKVLSLLLLAAALGLTWATPVVGLCVVLVTVLVLRAGDKAARGLESRRVRRGERASDFVGTLLRSPLQLPGALMTSAMVVPISLGAGLVLALALVGGGRPAAQALTFGALLAVVLQIFGPGGTAPRRQTARIWGAFLPRQEAAMIAVLCLGAGVAVLLLLVLGQDPDLGALEGFARWLDDARSTVKGWIVRFGG
ncbi:serine/threonine-protein kinase [Actinocorallia populi]|uniref:serine/threonine-protein kinase n=1 Tax=Actinocorallia populi TaxID=2079200 RepID=UPI001300368F|nr:serine/threonine-protein kinase [Actinocorallia populi]